MALAFAGALITETAAAPRARPLGMAEDGSRVLRTAGTDTGGGGCCAAYIEGAVLNRTAISTTAGSISRSIRCLRDCRRTVVEITVYRKAAKDLIANRTDLSRHPTDW